MLFPSFLKLDLNLPFYQWVRKNSNTSTVDLNKLFQVELDFMGRILKEMEQAGSHLPPAPCLWAPDLQLWVLQNGSYARYVLLERFCA